MNLIDMSRLPAPDIIEDLDYEQIFQEGLADFRSRNPEWTAILESDPVVKLLEALAYREVLIRSRINDAAKAVMLAYATGSDLEQIGALFGVKRLSGEPDDRLRYRIQQGFSALSVAGPSAAYRTLALRISNAIVDASVESGTPGRVDVTVLGWEIVQEEDTQPAEIANGQRLFPSVVVGSGEAVVMAGDASDLLNAVRLELSGESVRPLTDQVVVSAPVVKTTDITARLHIYRGPDPQMVLSQALSDLDDYLKSIRLLGYDMTRAGIIAVLAVPGVQNVLLDAPQQDIVCAFNEIALEQTIAVTIEQITE